MRSQDTVKLLDAGYRFIRTRDTFKRNGDVQLNIYVKANGHDWRLLECDFYSKASRERRMVELLKDPKTLEL